MPNVWLVKNGEYWQARWSVRGRRSAKSLGHRDKMSEREANRRCRDIAFKLGNGTMPDGGSGKIRLGNYVEQYLRFRPEIADATAYQFRMAGAYLVAHFGEDQRIDRITKEDALEWQSALTLGELSSARKIDLTRAKGRLSPHTIAKLCRTAKTMFEFAVNDLELLPSNPFKRLNGSAPMPAKQWREVSRADMTKIFAACPNDGWRALFALCRFAGTRRGEALSLRWEDIGFDRNRMTINARITKTTTKKAVRVCPIEPPNLPGGLAAMLQAMPRIAGEVCHGVDVDNLDKAARRILKASVGVYAKPFHTLRKCFENELVMAYPIHVVEAWIGHSEEVAKRNYLRVSDELFGRVQTRVQASV